MRRASQRNSLVTLNEINITPLLDLAFVLLIIFIITRPLIEQNIKLDLPAGGSTAERIKPEDIARLEAKLQDAKARQKALLARHKTANSRLAARKKIHDYKIDDAMVRFEQYTRRIDDVEGRIEAYDLGLPKDLNHEFASLEAEESVQKEFDELKRRVQGETRQAADTE